MEELLVRRRTWFAAYGAPLYAPMEINDPGAYRYPPTFALLTVPMAPLPEPAVTPTLWVARLAALVGSPRLFLEGRVSRAGSGAAERGATRR